MKPATAMACAAALCAGIVHVMSLNARADETAASQITVTLDRFLNSGHPLLTSYRARRMLTASTMGGTMRASLEAWTTLDADGTFSFEVIRQEGSGLIRKRVLLAALETEQRTRNNGEMTQSELTTENYEFRIDDSIGDDGLATVRLFPRRKTPMLLNGVAIVRPQDGDIVRIAGRPAKSPSWWTKHVNIVRRYERIVGIRVPVEMGSQANVRIAGKATFSMTYEYESVNGQFVGVRHDDVSRAVSVNER